MGVMNTDTKPTIVGLGEALFDIFPKSESLGGAPLNVAFHAHQLGNHGVVASRIGDDELGRRVTRHLRARKMRADYLQIDTDRDTGTVNIILRDGEPSYEIVERVAWDEMHFDRRFAKLAENCDAVCFGTLAQRRSTSRQTVQRFVEKAELAVRLFDVNLRQDFFTGPTIEKSLKLANAAKLNTEELRIVGQLLELSGETPIHQVQQLREQFELEFVALTRGAEGGTCLS